MPGVMMWSGSISPGSTRCSTSATVTLAGRRHHRIEVARGLAIDEIALGVALEGVDDREIGDEAAFHDVALAVELALFLAAGDLGAGAGAGEEGRNAGAAGANALGERALRIEFDLQFAGEILLGESLVLADIGRDHLPDLPGFEQDAEADAVDAGIVGDDGEVFHPGIADGEDQRFRNAAQPEAAGHDHHAVLEHPGERGPRVGIDLVHERSLSCNAPGIGIIRRRKGQPLLDGDAIQPDGFDDGEPGFGCG